jgi:FKBP12-rapamycin complex-associated protein
LTENSKEGTLIYLDEVLEIIIVALQDKSSTIKRESAVRGLNEIIRNTGFVVLPYYHSPNLMDIILQLVRTEVTQEMRLECLRLLGNIGTIDSFNYKRTMLKMRESKALSSWMQYLPQTFRFIESYQQALQAHNQNQLLAEIHSYYEDLILMGGFQDQKRMLLHLA